MKRLTRILLLCVLACSTLAHADEASKRTKIDQLFVVMKMDHLMQQIMDQSAAQGEKIATNIFGNAPMSDADRKILTDFENKMQALLKDQLAWDKMKPAYLDLYAATYSEEDIDGILGFYKSTAGQHMVEKTPTLYSASQQIVMGRMQTIQPQLQQMTKDLTEQVQAAHKPENPK